MTAAERQEMNGAIPEVQPANEGGRRLYVCSRRRQLAARVEVQGPKKRSSDTCGITRNARLLDAS